MGQNQGQGSEPAVQDTVLCILVIRGQLSIRRTTVFPLKVSGKRHEAQKHRINPLLWLCTSLPAAKLHWKTVRNTLNTSQMLLSQENNCCSHHCDVFWL